MVVSCDQCGVLVDAGVLKTYGIRDEASGDDYRYSFAKCPDAQFKAEDARDLLEFTKAILEYVYTFRQRFEAFQKRRAARISKPSSAQGSL